MSTATADKNKPGAASGQAPAQQTAAPKKRNPISPAKALAIQIAGLVAILKSKAVAATLTKEQTAQVAAAEAAAKELNAKTLQPVLDRIKAIQAEFKALDITAPGAADKAKELAQELGRKQTKLKQLTGETTA